MMIDRPRYIKKLFAFKDSDIIKVISGTRGCGKYCISLVIYAIIVLLDSSICLF